MSEVVECALNENTAPFTRGNGDWAGVVMVIRPDVTKMSFGAEPMCRVVSARTVQLNGRRAIDCMLPLKMLAHHFTSEDADHIFCEAEFKDNVCPDGGGYLEIYGRSKSTLQDWVLYSQSQKQMAAAEKSFH